MYLGAKKPSLAAGKLGKSGAPYLSCIGAPFFSPPRVGQARMGLALPWRRFQVACCSALVQRPPGLANVALEVGCQSPEVQPCSVGEAVSW